MSNDNMQGLLSSFFLSVDNDQSTKCNGSEVENSLIDILRVAPVTTSVSYFGLLNDMGVPLEALMKGLFDNREQKFQNHNLIDGNMRDIDRLRHRKTYRIIFHPDEYMSFFLFIFHELTHQPLLRVIMRSPAVMIQSEEFFVEKTQASMLINIGENVLSSQIFITMAFKAYSTLMKNGTTSSSIFSFIQSILAPATRSGIHVVSTSIPPLPLCKYQEDQFISTSCPRFPLLSIEISSSYKEKNLLQFVNATYTAIQNMLLVCDKRAQMQDKNDIQSSKSQQMLSSFISNSAVERLRILIGVCSHWVECIISYLAVRLQHSSSTISKSKDSLQLDLFIEKCCFILMFAFNCGSVVNNSASNGYKISATCFSDHLKLFFQDFTHPPSNGEGCLSRTWRSLNDGLKSRSSNIQYRLLFLRVIVSTIVVNYYHHSIRIAKQSMPNLTQNVISDPHILSTRLLIDDFFSLCCEILKSGDSDQIDIALTSTAALLNGAESFTVPIDGNNNDSDSNFSRFNHHLDLITEYQQFLSDLMPKEENIKNNHNNEEMEVFNDDFSNNKSSLQSFDPLPLHEKIGQVSSEKIPYEGGCESLLNYLRINASKRSSHDTLESPLSSFLSLCNNIGKDGSMNLENTVDSTHASSRIPQDIYSAGILIRIRLGLN
jgi:hypothetical protein